MNRGVRHKVQRSRRVALKADAAILLDRIAALTPLSEHLQREVAEMRLRLAPPPGVKAPIILTNYPKETAA
jgi:hypothetical protein